MKKTIQGKQCMTNKRTLLKYLKPLCGENIEDMISNTTIIFMDNCGWFKILAERRM